MGNFIHMKDSEEATSTYEFKVVKKTLMREYPYIMDVIIYKSDEYDVNRYNQILLTLVINPKILSEYYNKPVKSYVSYFVGEKKQGGSYALISSMLNGMSVEEAIKVSEEFDKLTEGIHESRALPDEYKLPGDRYFHVAHYMIPKGDDFGLPLEDDGIF